MHLHQLGIVNGPERAAYQVAQWHVARVVNIRPGCARVPDNSALLGGAVGVLAGQVRFGLAVGVAITITLIAFAIVAGI